MGTLDDFLSLKPKGSLSGGGDGAVQEGLDSPLKPSTVGLKLIDAPSNLSNGLVYRMNGSTLERILVSDDETDPGNSTSVTVVATCSLSHKGVHVKASPDGRMVAVACIDGSLQCFDSTTGGMSLRWSIANAHSHVSPNICSTISKDRSKGACSSGPLLSLDFSPNDYILLLVDATNGVAMYDAKVSAPTNLVASQTQQFLQNVSCASWHASTKAGTTMPFAIGKYDRTVNILEYTGDATEPLQIASDLGRVEEDPSEEDPSEKNRFVCTHLNWSMGTLIAGVCLVVPPEDDEEPESDDEDDLAEHEACLYVTKIDDTLNRASKWSEQGDVVPFFTVPKFGKHVFFTSVLRSEKQLIAVATNVGTDIGVLSPNEKIQGEWNPVEFEEGSAAATPTNEDDEYVFPLGICLVQLPSSSFRLLLASTDGSISTFEYQLTNDEAFFSAPILGSIEDLPSDPLAIAAAPEPVGASSTTDNASWVVVDETNSADSTEPETTVAAPEPKQDAAAPSASAPFSFGASGSSAFGSGAKLSSSSPFGSSTFGSGTSKGLTFGSPSSGESPFAAFSKKGSTTASSSIFGATSPLGGSSGFGTTSSLGSGTATPAFGSATPAPSKTTATPSIGFGSPTFGSTTFGATTTPPGGGFAALSSNSTTGSFGSSTTSGGFGSSSGGFGSTTTDKSAFGSGKSPFKMFASPSNPSPASAFPTKPLFGSAPAPAPAAPLEDQTPAAQSETKAPAATPETKPDATPEPPKDTEEPKESSDAPLSDAEKKAAKLFDEFDTEKTRSLDISKFEDLSDALGEGLCGDEYDAQVALVDPSKSGKITRDNFIQWYKDLAGGSGDSDNESLDSDELREREEEREKAMKAFSSLSTKTEGDKAYIEVDDFGKLLESLDSTYCEEAHRKTIKKLKDDDGHIYESDFLEWYVPWLFADDDSDYDSDDDDESTGGEAADTDNGGEEKTESLANIFKVDESSWKCEICSVRNNDSVNKCISCETPRPGFEGASNAEGGAPKFGGADTSTASIGAGGFSLGGTAATSSSSIGTGGFSFGGSTAKSESKDTSDSATSTSAVGAGGFSFGGAASTATTDTAATKAKVESTSTSSSVGAGGFSFGGATKAKAESTSTSSSVGAVGFSFGGAPAAEKEPEVPASDDKALSDAEKKAAKLFDEFDTEKTRSLDISKFEDLSDALGEGLCGDEYDAQVALVDPSKSGKITRDNFIQWYKDLAGGSGDSDNESLDSDELREREEEREKAMKAFSSLSKTEGDKAYIEVDDFGKLLESLDSTYCEEAHRKTIKKLKDDDGHIYESDFLEWYVPWLFADDDSDYDSDDDDESTGGEAATTEKTESLANIFKVDESSWKCEICSVRNNDSVNKCISCETPRPGFEGTTSSTGGVKVVGAASSSSIGAGGFSFGGSAPAPDATSSSSIGTGGFSFGGSTVKPDAAPSSSAIGAGGFSFGASTAQPEKTSSTSIRAGGFTFGGSAVKPDAAPSSGGFSFSSKTEAKASSTSTVTPGKTPAEPLTKPTFKPDAAKSSSAAFPPMSKKAPSNPFSAKPAAKAPSSAAFPPMSAKAPTNPFGAKPAAKTNPFGSFGAKSGEASTSKSPFAAFSAKPASSNPFGTFGSKSDGNAPVFGAKPTAKPAASSTNAAFPPMSAKAPSNPFGSKAAAKPAVSSTNAAFPPMSAKAPSNPFGPKPTAKTSSSSTNAAFPPMSAKAPSNPFGPKPTAKTSSSSTNAAFPPMSAKAPSNPFGAKASAKTSSSSTNANAAFPPMSAKAPSNPFGPKPTAKTSSSSTNAAFPPMSAKAPSNPFGPKPTAKTSSSSTNAAFPPMSAKAPSNPFGPKPTAKTSSSSTNAAFPPMSAKAPSNPFGPKPTAKTSSSSTNAAFPPMSAKAPSNPFGAKASAKTSSSSTNAAFPPMSAKAPSNPFGPKPTAKTSSSSTNAAFPPMSAKAPSNPFGPKPTAKTSSSSTNAAFPPMSAKAPSNPFGAKASAKTSSSSTNANAAFPPMSAKAPSNPFGPKPTAKTSASSATSAASSASTASSGFGGSLSQKSKSRDPAPKIKKSEMQIQFDSVLSSFASTVTKVSQMRTEVSKGDREIREDIESYAIQTENDRSKLLNLDDSLGKSRSVTAFLLSRKTDATRQVDAASKIVQESKLSNAEGAQSIAGSQALDRESEMQRRKFAASSRSVVRTTKLIEERVELLQHTLTDPPEQRHRCVLQGVMNLYYRSKDFEEVTSRITSNIDQASRSVPHHARTRRSAGRSTYSLDSIEDSPLTPNRRQLKPVPIRIGSAKKPVKSKTSASHWKGIESSLQQLGNTSVRVNRFNTISVGGNKDQTPRAKNNVAKQNTPSRSLLMSPSTHRSPNVGHERALTLSTKINIFSPPSKTKARSGWDKPSTIDRNQMNKLEVNAPQELKQTTLSNASRETLARFGTTPENLRATVDIKKNEAASIPSSVGSAKSKEGPLKRSTGGAAAFPPLSSKAPSNPFSSNKKVETPKPVPLEKKSTPKSTPSSAPLPPMPKKAPSNPFAKASASKPPLSQAQSKPASATKVPAFGSSEKASKKESPAPSTPFGNMKGLGDSLFSSGSTQKDEKQQPAFGSAPSSNSSQDYKAILTSFYQKHNASRLGEVDKTLAKYKGREQEMFQKLAAKYKVPNPLQEPSKPSGGVSSSSGFGNLGSTSSAPTATPSSGFGSTGSTMGASPFGSPSGTAQQTPAASTSPFGKPATNSTPFGKPATSASPFGSSSGQSPFGASSAQNTSTPFGSSSTPAPSPFGNTASSTSSSSPFGSAAGGLASASPFGSSAAPTPFGAPSPSPMQQGSQRLFNGKSARDLLLQFYQEKNPSKVSEVDKLLAKYSGKEDQMFRNLAKKYQLNPSVFGVSAGAPAPSPGFGAASPTPAFGQASTMGSGASPFGSPGGFGSPSTFGGAPKPSGSTFGSSATSSFGSSSGFGSLAQSSSPSPFGGQSSGFGSPAPAFGSSSPFGAPRR